jgi:CRP/FNR family cyclic AMP-dependent transcriptional regulator
MNERQYQVVRVIQKLELFKGLEAEQVKRLLTICQFQDFEAGDEVYAAGSQSREMLVLLTGCINVLGETGELLAEITPGSSVGEMGVFTGEPRSAAIVTAEKSRGIAITKWELEKLLEENPDLYIKVLKNLVAILSNRLVSANRLSNENMATILKMQDELVRATGKTLRELEESR